MIEGGGKASELTSLLYESMRERCSELEGKSIVVLYSGGLDSAVVAKVARNTLGHAGPSLHTFGIEGSRDIANARQGAEFIDIEWFEHELTDETILEGAQGLLDIIPDLSFLELSYELPLYLGMKETDSEIVLTGQGADELFGGYARYRETSDPLELRMMLDRDLVKLFTRTKKVERRIASHFGKSLITPFLFEGIITFSSSLSLDELIWEDGTNKVVLRESARLLGLPEVICSRPKLAAQYGSGISKVMKRLRKGGKLVIDQMEAGSEEYNSPFAIEKQ